MSRSTRRWLVAAAAGAVAALVSASPAAAHPLGNFSVNHHHTLVFDSGGVADLVVIDRAEIPTAQITDEIDVDGDGVASPSERAAHATGECAAVATATRLTVDGASADGFVVVAASFAYVDGQAGLPTSRLECRLEAAIDLTFTRTIGVDDEFAGDRVGWHEMVATATSGVHLVDSPVPTRSTTGELRVYPVDPLASPLDVRSASFDVAPGDASTLPAAQERSPQVGAGDTGPMSAFVGGVEARFDHLIGQRDLTLGVGLLAVGLALVLGASHALLPGHGKTLMAAYIAGRQGTSRDAVVVGATVTATHTGGVLAVGLALTLSTSLAGERVLGWLGLASGVLVAGMGAGLLISNVRRRGAGAGLAHGHRHGYRFDHDHDHGHHRHQRHGHGHDHYEHHDHLHAAAAGGVGVLERQQLTEAFGRRQFTGVTLEPEAPIGNVSRRGLIGMGIAGGLVPSPSALVILLSAIALGRTWFGVLLVIGYGLGMAGTLTAAGLLLVVVRDRLGARIRTSDGRLRRAARAWSRCTPYLTAALVLVVGAGLALRSLPLL